MGTVQHSSVYQIKAAMENQEHYVFQKVKVLILEENIRAYFLK